MKVLIEAGWAALAVLLFAALSPAAQAEVEVDLQLVLAVDVSYSMDIEEQRLQRDGYVAALRDPTILKAIKSGFHGRIAVTYLEWAGPETQTVIVPWTAIDGAESAETVAAVLAERPPNRLRMTSISSALAFAGRQFENSGFRGGRRVIDISGDGVNNSGPVVAPIREEIIARGIVINGLPVMVRPGSSWNAYDIMDLDVYYANCVIGGEGAFMIPIRNASEFITATRQKLLLEISGLMPEPRLYKAQLRLQPAPADCLAAERRIQRDFDGWRR
ncbi:MAG TPA: DUF1194 domain-containing protein [Hyphomicrobiaceae bacterium]|nr:DUF1194 domain-containing protein [Hyphomicrobiaceae bacterium]